MTQGRGERLHRRGRIRGTVDVTVGEQAIIDEIDESSAELGRTKPPRVVQLSAQRADPWIATASKAARLLRPGPLDLDDRVREVDHHQDHRRNDRDDACQYENRRARW